MTMHLSRDLQKLHRTLLSMSSRVEDMIHQAVNQLGDPNFEEAVKIAKLDDAIDELDVEIEEDCLKVLALNQPVGVDLRRIATVMKISGELERVADIAANIAQRACGLAESPEIPIPDRLQEMAHDAVDMLHRAIDAYVDLDSVKAMQVCADDDSIDDMNRQIIEDVIADMHRTPSLVEPLLHLFSASRQIERVADHATNIAEDVVYLVEGTIIRHGRHFVQNQVERSS
ncbi:MAG: phosphate signaling complex protein PhoU [Planctomycetaceae bacterium]|nr:phosphate signaling complex protein PhoU [Planctomycetaceae bacterium]